MPLNLFKGETLNLTRECIDLSEIMIGLGWDEVKQKRGLFYAKSAGIDCDLSAFLISNDKPLEIENVVYYANLKHKSGAVEHRGDNLTGRTERDAEQISVDFKRLPAIFNRIVFAVIIYDADKKQQHFGMMQNAFIRVFDSKKEICRYSLSENYDGKTAIIFGDVTKSDDEWRFAAIGQATNNDLSGLAWYYR